MATLRTVVDDIDNEMGVLTIATHLKVPISFDGQKRVLDLGDPNYEALRALWRPWFAGGDQEASPVVSVPNTVENAAFRAMENPAPDRVTLSDPDDTKYGLYNRSGRWVAYPGLVTFGKSVGTNFAPISIPPALLELYRDARDSGEFVPDEVTYPRTSPKNRKLLAGLKTASLAR
jgi:hypothetical protein